DRAALSSFYCHPDEPELSLAFPFRFLDIIDPFYTSFHISASMQSADIDESFLCINIDIDRRDVFHTDCPEVLAFVAGQWVVLNNIKLKTRFLFAGIIRHFILLLC